MIRMKRCSVVALAIMILSCLVAAGTVYADASLQGEYHSLRNGKTSEFRLDGTVNWEGTEGTYVLENDELIIIIGGNAQKYEIRFINRQMILFDPTGSGEVFEKVRGSDVPDFSGITVGDVVYFGVYEQDDNPDNGPEEIEWEVLDIRDGKALLLSKYTLDCQPYSSYLDKGTWEECSLREWLNDEFLNSAFSPAEQGIINITELKNEDNPIYQTSGGADTEDQVFLLSLQDVENYFGFSVSEEWVPHEELIGRMTERCRHLMLSLGAEYQEEDPEEFEAEYTEEVEGEYGRNAIFWWLRSPGQEAAAACIYFDGAIRAEGMKSDFSFITIRPAMWIDIES